jgi:hypothetical protein
MKFSIFKGTKNILNLNIIYYTLTKGATNNTPNRNVTEQKKSMEGHQQKAVKQPT